MTKRIDTRQSDGEFAPPRLDRLISQTERSPSQVDDNHSDRTTVTFMLPAWIEAQYASVVGDFNRWDPAEGSMERNGDGLFSRTVEVARGHRYQYRFLLDGDRWANDWSADAYAPNSFGGEDSVLDLTNDPGHER